VSSIKPRRNRGRILFEIKAPIIAVPVRPYRPSPWVSSRSPLNPRLNPVASSRKNSIRPITVTRIAKAFGASPESFASYPDPDLVSTLAESETTETVAPVTIVVDAVGLASERAIVYDHATLEKGISSGDRTDTSPDVARIKGPPQRYPSATARLSPPPMTFQISFRSGGADLMCDLPS